MAKKARKAKMKTKTKKSVKTKTHLSLLNIKVTAADKRALDAAARKYGKGNLSAWLRYAGTTFKRPIPALVKTR